MTDSENTFDDTFWKTLENPFDTVSLDEWSKVLIKLGEDHLRKVEIEKKYDAI